MLKQWHSEGKKRACDIAIVCALCVVSGIIVIGTRGVSTRIAQAFHGFYHSAYIYQIYNGFLPPTNPLSIGMPAEGYWGWHLFVSLLMRAFSITALEGVTLSSAIGLALVFTAIWLGIRNFGFHLLPRLILTLLPLWVVALPLIIGKRMLGFGDMRIHFLLKFLYTCGFPFACGLYCVLIALATRETPRRPIISSASCAILAALICFVHPTTGTATLCIALASLCTAPVRSTVQRTPLLREAMPAIAMLLGFTALVPYMASLQEAIGMRATVLLHYDPIIANIHRMGFAVTIPLLAIIVSVMLLRKLSAQGHTLLLTTLFMLGGAYLLSIPDANQYKYGILLAIPTTFLIASLIPPLYEITKERSLVRYVLFPFVGGISLTLSMWMTYHDVHSTATSRWAKSDPYVFEGTTTSLRAVTPDNKGLMEAITWVRAFTPVDAYLLQEPRGFNDIWLTTYAERRLIAGYGWIHSTAIPHQNALVRSARRLIEELEKGTISAQTMRSLLLVPAPWPDRFYAFAHNPSGKSSSMLTQALTKKKLPLRAVYANPSYAVYEVTVASRGDTE